MNASGVHEDTGSGPRSLKRSDLLRPDIDIFSWALICLLARKALGKPSWKETAVRQRQKGTRKQPGNPCAGLRGHTSRPRQHPRSLRL
jgi:hypothetical protein